MGASWNTPESWPQPAWRPNTQEDYLEISGQVEEAIDNMYKISDRILAAHPDMDDDTALDLAVEFLSQHPSADQRPPTAARTMTADELRAQRDALAKHAEDYRETNG